MKTTESQKTTSHQPATQKPFFGASPEQAFFSTQRAESTPFFQPKADTPSAIQAKSATTDAEGIREEEVQRMPAFESEVSTNGEVQRKLMNSPPHSSALPIQAKLTIGEPGDKYEQEADRVASQVVEQINAPAPAQSTQGQSVQRQEENKEELQAKPEITSLQRQEEKPEELQTKPEITVLQHQKENKEELQTKSNLQHGEAIGGGEASTELASAINSAQGGGQSLDAGLQWLMGQAMGADFSGVRVHTDAQADQLNRSIQAKAFTTGQDVFFRQGAYEPGSRGGQELIAHELTHVVQQKQGRVKPTLQMKRVKINDDEGKVTFESVVELGMGTNMLTGEGNGTLTVAAKGIKGNGKVTATGHEKQINNWTIGFIQTVFKSNREFFYDQRSGARYRDFLEKPARDGDEISDFWFEEPSDDEKFNGAEDRKDLQNGQVEKTCTTYITDDPHTPSLLIGGVPVKLNRNEGDPSYLIQTAGEDDFGTWLAITDGQRILPLEYFPWHIDWKSQVIDGKINPPLGGAFPEAGTSGGGEIDMVIGGPSANAASKEEWTNP